MNVSPSRLDLSPYTNRAFALLRLVSALLFLQHGLQKLSGWPPSETHAAPAPILSLFGATGVLESVGGILVLVGLFTRPAAFVLCGEMAVAY